MATTGSSTLYRFLVCACIAYIVLRPVSAGEVLYPVLAILGVTGLGALLFVRRRASGSVLATLGLALVVAMYGMYAGASNPGVFQHGAVWVGGIVVYGFWALGADERLLRPLFQVLAWTTIALSVLIVLYVGSQLGLVPGVLPAWLIEEAGAGFNIEDGATAIRLYGLSSLVAAAPMWVSAAVMADHPMLPRRWVRVLAGGAATGAALLGGRNAIVLVLVLVPLLVFVVHFWLGRRGTWTPTPLTFVIGAFVILASPLAVMWALTNPAVQRTWSNVLGFFQEDGQSVRIEQIDRLLRAWQESPVFGHGFGATIPNYARSALRPWNFEMQYHMLLFQLGIVGLILVAAVVVAAIAAIRSAVRTRPDLAPLFLVALAAAGGMLIANATNPYLQAPGHMWALFLPLLVANVARLRPDSASSVVRSQTGDHFTEVGTN